MNQRYRPYHRLRTKGDFARMRDGRRVNCGGIRIVYKPNALGHSRLGFAVARKLGNAVRRNRFKRQIRETFRRQICRSMSLDILVIPTRPLAEIPAAADDFLRAMEIIKKRLQNRG